MNTEILIIERIKITGRSSDGDSDIQAQTRLLDAGYRIVEVRTHGDDFLFVGERPYEPEQGNGRLRERLASAEKDAAILKWIVDNGHLPFDVYAMAEQYVS